MATEGLDPAAASERLRARAGASQRTVADVAREVVQDQAEASQKDAGADGPPASPRGQHHSL